LPLESKKMLHQVNGGAYTLCERRRFLGGASHFTSFHKALAEQSATFALTNKLVDANVLDYHGPLVREAHKNKREITARAISLLLVEQPLRKLNS
jgi:hypothetical protein